MPKLPQLDGVRGVAILLVLSAHAGSHLPSTPGTAWGYLSLLNSFSWSGVDLFFVLSGFLIGGGLMDARESDDYFGRFYLRRACRIIPAYLVALAVAIVLTQSLNINWMPTGLYLTFTQNFWMAAHGWNFALSQTWSLAVEEQFYLTLPLLIWIVPRRALLPVLLTLLISALLARIAINFIDGPSVATGWAIYVLFPSRMDALLFGVIAAIAIREKSSLEWLDEKGKALYVASALLLCCIMIMMAKHQTIFDPVMSTIGYTAIDGFYTVVLLLALRDGPVKVVCSMPALRACGRWAYGMYLFHNLLIGVADRFGVGAVPVAIAASFCVGALSWRYIESPFINFAHRKSKIPVHSTKAMTLP